MAHVSRGGDGKINGWFNCPQPDAFDEAGKLICKGTPTEEIADDDPELVQYLAGANN